MPNEAYGGGGVANLIVLIAVAALIVLRNSRPRKLRVEFLWVRPMIILLFGVLYFSYFQPKSLVEIAGLVAAFAIGAGVGWWRGGFTRIDVDPATHLATQQASLLGILVIMGIFVLRYALRMVAMQGGMNLPVSPIAIAGWLMAFAVGLVVLQQLEIWLRARRLIGEAKNKAA